MGFYVHGVSVEAADLPDGWEARTISVCDSRLTRGGTGLCVESHDLAASKLSAFREKDLEFVTVLLSEGLVEPSVLLARIGALHVDEEHRD